MLVSLRVARCGLKPELTMTRQRALLVIIAALLAVGAGLARLGFSPASAQSQDYLPPPPPQTYTPDAPQSIKPPPRDSYSAPGRNDNPGYGQPYGAPPPPPPPGVSAPPPGEASGPPPRPAAYSSNEILETGHRFFGSVSEGMGKVVEYAFQRNGHPTGYILGEEAGGAVIAGLRYGEGTLYTKGFPPQKVYWQGPSLGYDIGANGAKSLTLVYNLTYPSQIYERYAGIDGSAYLVGGIGITFQQHDDVILAPIRAGLGLRLGANVGYLKYTPSPTWNPF
jgi:hypothetical protein